MGLIYFRDTAAFDGDAPQDEDTAIVDERELVAVARGWWEPSRPWIQPLESIGVEYP